MFKLNEIQELIKLVDETTSIQEVEIENDGKKIAIRKPKASEVVTVHAPAPTYAAPVAAAPVAAPVAAAPAAAPAAAAPAASTEGLHEIKAIMTGTFYRKPSPDKPNYVEIGAKVSEKSIVCILEAMKLMNEIEAGVKGEIVEIKAQDGQLIEFGQTLFLVRPE